jgi:ketosteroid isomerase-like protein
MRGQVTTQFLDEFAAAWNRHDVEAILAAMTPDCIFRQSAGTSPEGASFVGQDAVRQGVQSVFITFPDARWTGATHFIAGDRGVSEWVFTGTGPNGYIEVHGCDVFTFRDGLIAVKDSYRKQRAG